MLKKTILMVALCSTLFVPVGAKPTCVSQGTRTGGGAYDNGCHIVVRQYYELESPNMWGVSYWESTRFCAGYPPQFFSGSGEYHSSGHLTNVGSTCPFY